MCRCFDLLLSLCSGMTGILPVFAHTRGELVSSTGGVSGQKWALETPAGSSSY